MEWEGLDCTLPLIERVDPGQGFNWHYDQTADTKDRRILAGLLYLKTVASGGHTQFLHQNTDVKPEAGKIVLFPPFWTHIHRGVTPAAGAWLDKVAAALRGLPRAELQIVGPTDARGAGGQALAVDRAASARDWMVVRGVAPRRMAVSGADPRGRAPAVDGRLHILVGERAAP